VVGDRNGNRGTPPVFCQKSVDFLDYKGVEFFGKDKEFVRVSNDEV